MGKASSAKKVARAARAGGSRRPGQRRALGFPLVVFSVVVLGTLLVLFARNSREVNAAPRSGAAGVDADHWHAAYGLSFCGEFQRNTEGTRLVDIGADTLGIHTHGDGVIHIHPFLDSAGGRNARMRIFLDQVGLSMSDSTLEFPDGDTWDEGEDTCTVDGPDGDQREVPGELVVAKWNDAQDAADGERPNDVFTDDFGSIRFENDREYYTIAFVPEGELEDIPVRPDVISDLGNLSDVIQAPEDSTSTSEGQTTDDSSTSSTVADDTASSTTATTAADASTSTTAASE